jgi:serine/threonine protein kinase
MKIPGYKILHRIHPGSRTQVYRAIDEKTNYRPVTIKLASISAPTFEVQLQLRNHYATACHLRHPQIIETYQLEPYQNSYALVMEDYGGVALGEWLNLTMPSLESKLQIAIDLTDALAELARQRIIHKNINPTNILVHPTTQQVKLIDFGIASLLPKETVEIRSPNILEGTLAYIAPEQTGRLNRGIDYRCDFYSLGVTLYELFTGELPFQAEDPMGWVHAHLTKIAVSAEIVNPAVPKAIAGIVAKLMVKNPEDRYQNAIGIKYDLEECLAQLRELGTVEELTIGRQDRRDRFLVSEQMYGREAEVQTLLAAFDRVSQGSTELVLVSGNSGIGKTAMVNQVHPPITRQQGYFIKGKFDRFNRDLPLSALVRAARDLVGQLLSESQPQLAIWKSQILAAVGENGQILIDAIPKLKQLIGKQPPVPELTGIAVKNRFNGLFQKFIAVFTTAEHPLTIFLDDLQWADLASLQTIELLMQSNGYLLLVGAYRQVSADHPLMSMVAELEQAEQIVSKIALTPLTAADIDRLVADTLHCSIAQSQPLAQLIALKTQGNPFFITQFLQALYTNGAIRFVPPTAPVTFHPVPEDTAGWECDMVAVEALAVTEDVV